MSGVGGWPWLTAPRGYRWSGMVVEEVVISSPTGSTSSDSASAASSALVAWWCSDEVAGRVGDRGRHGSCSSVPFDSRPLDGLRVRNGGVVSPDGHRPVAPRWSPGVYGSPGR